MSLSVFSSDSDLVFSSDDPRSGKENFPGEFKEFDDPLGTDGRRRLLLNAGPRRRLRQPPDDQGDWPYRD